MQSERFARVVAIVAAMAVLSLLISVAFLADRALYYRAKWFATQSLVRAPLYSLVQDREELVTPSRARWVLLGDSRFFQLPVPERFNLRPKTGVSLVNKGEGGAMANRTMEIFKDEVLALHPRGALVQVGINEVMALTPEQAQSALETFVADFVSASRQNGIEPAVSTILPVSQMYLFQGERLIVINAGKYERWNATVARINDRIRQYCAQNNVRMLDLEATMKDDQGRVQAFKYDGDGVHLAEDGQRSVVEAIVRFIGEQ
jgi:lysophospholipase L1-like esterase